MLNGKLKGVKTGIAQISAEYIVSNCLFTIYHIVNDLKRKLTNGTYLAHAEDQ